LYKRICLVKYERSDEISSQLSKKADIRLIWGGDETVNQFQKYATSPRCIDLKFANRYSISIIDVNKLAKLSNNNLENIVNRFYNDSYTMDQKGCSSPQALIWIGKDKKKIKDKFFNTLSKIADKKYDNDYVLIILLLGNDYLPKLSNVDYDTIINNYSQYVKHGNPKIIINKNVNIDNLIMFITYIGINKKIKLNINNLDNIRFKKYYNNILWCLKKYKVLDDSLDYNYEYFEDINKVINIYNFIYSLI
jgi:hypothetical protein